MSQAEAAIRKFDPYWPRDCLYSQRMSDSPAQSNEKSESNNNSSQVVAPSSSTNPKSSEGKAESRSTEMPSSTEGKYFMMARTSKFIAISKSD